MPEGEVARRLAGEGDLSKSFGLAGFGRVFVASAALRVQEISRVVVRLKMTSTGELWVFAGLIVLGQFSPGPDMVLLTRTALREGAKAGVEMAVGIACGLAVHSTIAVGGVAVAFQRLPMLRLVLQWVAAFYLLWLAYGLLRVCFISWQFGSGPGGCGKGEPASAVCPRLVLQFIQPEGGVVSGGGVRAVSGRKSSGLVAVCHLGGDRGTGDRFVVAVGSAAPMAAACGCATNGPADGSTGSSALRWWRWRSA